MTTGRTRIEARPARHPKGSYNRRMVWLTGPIENRLFIDIPTIYFARRRLPSLPGMIRPRAHPHECHVVTATAPLVALTRQAKRKTADWQCVRQPKSKSDPNRWMT